MLNQSLWHFRIVLLLLAVALVLPGCSFNLGYRYLDVLIAWRVDDYIDWNLAQQSEFEPRVRRLVEWHQSTQLAQYQQFLRDLKATLDKPLDLSTLEQIHRQIVGFSDAVITQAIPDSVFLLNSLTDQQVKELNVLLQKEHEELRSKYTEHDSDELRKTRLKRAKKLLRRWLGDLSENQKQLVSQWNQGLISTNEGWLVSRNQWNGELLLALQARAEPEFEQRIQRLFLNPQEFYGDKYTKELRQNTRSGYKLLMALQKTLTAKQRRHLDSQLDKWMRRFQKLEGQTGSKSM